METAVLKNNIAAVKEHFEEYGEFEFTARALGLATRFCGSEMVKDCLRMVLLCHIHLHRH